MRLRSPSTTFTLTITVSPGAKSGIFLPRRAISSCSSVAIRFILFPLVVRKLVPAGTPPVAELPVLLTGVVPANPDDVPQSCPMPASIATSLFRRGARTSTLPGRPRRYKLRAACSAYNQAVLARRNPAAPMHHRPTHRVSAAPCCPSISSPPTRRRTTRSRRWKSLHPPAGGSGVHPRLRNGSPAKSILHRAPAAPSPLRG